MHRGCWIAELTGWVDDPDLWHGAPISVQLVGRQMDDERLLAVSAVVDEVVNGTKGG